MNPFISYAQNCEDVLLWRALKHIKNGFYIDVGANDPEAHSVTKAFYERGWYGINIEPLPEFHQRFEAERPRDINLSIAAGAVDGDITLYDVPSVRGWASPDQSVAAMHREEGFEVTELSVPVRKLSDICQQHVQGQIHFLKIDVEGFEGEVLRGMDFVAWRPWIVVVEATLPNSRVTNHHTWENLLTDHNYQCVYFDGLNRYYVAAEHACLQDALRVQANVFDNFVTVHLSKAWQAGVDARELEQQAENRANNAILEQKQARELEQQAENRANNAILEQKQAHAQAANALAQTEQALIATNDARNHAQQAQVMQLHAERIASESRLLASHAETKASYAAARAEAAEAVAEAALARALAAEAQTARTAAWAHNVNALREQVLASLSWRITRPLRELSAGYRQHIVTDPFPVRWLRQARQAITSRFARIVLWTIAREPLRRVLIPQLARMTWLNARLGRIIDGLRPVPPQAPAVAGADVPPHMLDLPLSARKVLSDLARAHHAAARF
jgi:FkbM family methyltransferase